MDGGRNVIPMGADQVETWREVRVTGEVQDIEVRFIPATGLWYALDPEGGYGYGRTAEEAVCLAAAGAREILAPGQLPRREIEQRACEILGARDGEGLIGAASRVVRERDEALRRVETGHGALHPEWRGGV